MAERVADRQHLTIGEVLSLLQQEFPDVSISKIRFLESQGLVDPERTPSGYRKFYDRDVERLRWILRQQREHFLPLKVIRGRLTGEEVEEGADGRGDAPPDENGPLAAAAAGVTPDAEAVVPAALAPGAQALPEPSHPFAAVAAPAADAPSTKTHVPETDASDGPASDGRASDGPGSDGPGSDGPGSDASVTDAPVTAAPGIAGRPAPARPGGTPRAAASRAGTGGAHTDVFTAAELAEQAGCEVALIVDLEQFGIIRAGANVGGVAYYDPGAVTLAKLGARFAELGVEPRHLRTWRNSADREASLFEQLVMPLLRQRNPHARHEAADRLEELTRLGGELRAGLIAEAVGLIR